MEEALRSKEAALQGAYDKLAQMKEDLELLNERIVKEQAEVERLRDELGEGWCIWLYWLASWFGDGSSIIWGFFLGGGRVPLPLCHTASVLFFAVYYPSFYCIDLQMSQEAMEHLKKELEGVIQALNKRLEELQNLAKEQQARIRDLEQEGEDLRAELVEGKDAQETLEDIEQKLQCKFLKQMIKYHTVFMYVVNCILYMYSILPPQKWHLSNADLSLI